MKRYILTAFAATSLLFSSTQAFALINFSAGVPFSHTITGKMKGGEKIESDGTSGVFIQIGLPIFPGIGMDKHYFWDDNMRCNRLPLYPEKIECGDTSGPPQYDFEIAQFRIF